MDEHGTDDTANSGDEDRSAVPADFPGWCDEADADAGFACEPPDLLDLVVEADALVAIVTAQKLERLADFYRDQLAQAVRGGYGTGPVVQRGIRLEVAAALRITETAAGILLHRAEVLTGE